MTPADPYGHDGPPLEVEMVGVPEDNTPATRTLLTVLVTVLGLALVAGVVLVVGLLTRSDHIENVSFPLEGTDMIRIDTADINVRVVPADGSELLVSARVSEGFLATGFSADLVDGVVVVRADCLSWLIPGCGADITVAVPRDMPLQAKSSSGNIEFADIGGVVKATTDSGDVVASGLGVVEIDVTTSSGDIDLQFAQPPYGVKARSSSGDVEVDMPGSDIGYVVNVASASGEVTNGLPSERGEGFVTVDTDSGDVEIIRR